MTTFYIEQAAGEFCAFDESDPVIAGISAMPEDVRPVLHTATAPAVVAWIDRVARYIVPEIEQARTVATSRTGAFANTLRERIAASKHYLQAARWSIQLASARAIKAGSATGVDTSALGREARLRGLGESVDQLADKVLGNSLIFASVGAAVDGIERATLDKIAAYNGTDATVFDVILDDARAVALAEFLDIFTPVYGPAGAQARAAAFFGTSGA